MVRREWSDLIELRAKCSASLSDPEYKDRTREALYLKKLVDLGQEQNLLTLESLSELRDMHDIFLDMKAAQALQIELLKKIAGVPSPPGVLNRQVLLFETFQK
jgi:hypothetical protein